MIDAIEFFVDMNVINLHDTCWDFVIDEFLVVDEQMLSMKDWSHCTLLTYQLSLYEYMLIFEFKRPWYWKHKSLELLHWEIS